MKPVGRIGDRERAVVEERTSDGYRATIDQLADHEGVLRSLLDVLLPGVPADIDLAAFVDAHTGRPLGRGDRRAGLPSEPALLVDGLAALAAAGFDRMAPSDQRGLVTRMRHGAADEELGLPAKDFVDRLLDKALTGYLAHPDIWARIGFAGPAYPEGYAWIGPAEAVARHERKPGWDRL